VFFVPFRGLQENQSNAHVPAKISNIFEYFEFIPHFEPELSAIFLSWFHVKHPIACDQATGKLERQSTLPIQIYIQSA